MTEVIQIISQLFLFLFLSSFPVNKISTPGLYVEIDNSIFNTFFFNIIFLFLILLISSFLSINLKLLFLIIVIFYLSLFFLNFKKYIKSIYKIKLELLLFFIIINLFLFFNISYNLQLGWDGLATWINKANHFYSGRNYFELFSSDNNPYPQYPHLGSFIWAFFWKNSFIESEYIGRLYYFFLYLTSLFVLISSFKNLSFYKKIIFLFILLIFSYDSTLEGYQEYIIFSLLIFCAKLILLLKENKNNNYLFYFLILATCLLPWIKNEGYFYSFFISLLFFFSNCSKQKKFFFIILVLFNILLQIYFMKILFRLDNLLQFTIVDREIYYFSFDYVKSFNLIKKIFTIIIYIFHGLFKYPLALLNILSFVMLFAYRNIFLEYRIFVFFLLLNILFIFGVYIMTPYDLVWHLQTSIKRLILQTSGFYFFIFIALYNKKILKI